MRQDASCKMQEIERWSACASRPASTLDALPLPPAGAGTTHKTENRRTRGSAQYARSRARGRAPGGGGRAPSGAGGWAAGGPRPIIALELESSLEQSVVAKS
jgi:hypothetical protein